VHGDVEVMDDGLRPPTPPNRALLSPNVLHPDPKRPVAGEIPSPLLFSWTPAA